MLLYIHIPYCDSKCHYCSFNSYVDKFDTRKDYMLALYKQLAYELKRFDAKNRLIKTVFIGGGTPSTVDPKLYKPIFTLIKPYLQENAEITTEANPNSATPSWLKGMKELGVNRISFGVQSFDDRKLKALNRAHDTSQAKEAIINAHQAGFKHISLDLIYNFKGDSKKLIENDIKQAFLLPIDHISAYELTIEKGTLFSATPELRQENDELAFFVSSEIKKRGFKQYEISNFGTYQSEHNKGYWALDDYIGAGAGAVGFLKNIRYYPQNNIEDYIKNPFKIREEKLSDNELLTEKIFLGLRSSIGIDKANLPEHIFKRAILLADKGKLKIKENHFYNKNYFLSDEISLFLMS